MIQSYVAEAQARLTAADRARRSAMAGYIAGPYSILMALGILGRVVVFLHDPSIASSVFEIGNSLALTVVTGIFIWAYLAARRQHPARAALLVSIGSLAAPLIYQVQVIGETNLTFAIVIVSGAYLNAIMAAGIIGSQRLLLFVTLVGIAISAVVYLLLPQPGTTPAVINTSTQSVLFITAALILGSGFLIMAAGARGYERVQQGIINAEMQVAFAQQVDQAKNLFIANVNHELRNPAMALDLSLSSLLRLYRTLDAGDAEALITSSRGIVRRLIDLINSILEANGVGQQPLDLRPLAVSAVVREAVELVPSPDARDIHLHLAPDLWVQADTTALRQIITNLVSNALKYSPVTESITITAAATADGWVEVQVRDQGLGIPPDQVPLLFQQFVRLPRDIESPITGNGVGLYLCRVLAEAMGGRIWVESSGVAGEGSTFIMWLPLAAAPVGTVATGSPSREFVH